MVGTKKKRALVVLGAGASVEFGIPATVGFGDLIRSAIHDDEYCQFTGASAVYDDVQERLLSYYNGNKGEAHFERVYHVMHELSVLRVTPGAVAKFRPVMYPFLGEAVSYESEALNAACKCMLDFIYKRVSEACSNPRVPTVSLTGFFSDLEERYVPRVYTTNYDDFVGQAVKDRYFTGFNRVHDDHADFDAGSFWSSWNSPGLFHVHGSVHMGFPHPSTEHDIGDIAWYPDRETARMFGGFSGSGISRMDGTRLERGAIITGLDKLGRLQQSPYAFYYAGFSRDAMEADLIIVLGSGLADLHLNTVLKSARRAKPNVPILYVGFWGPKKNDFLNTVRSDASDREIALLHDLGIDLWRLRESAFKAADGWTVDARGTGAVWADGFQSFLSKPEAFELAMKKIGGL